LFKFNWAFNFSLILIDCRFILIEIKITNEVNPLSAGCGVYEGEARAGIKSLSYWAILKINKF